VRVAKGAELLTFLVDHADAQDSVHGVNLARHKAAIENRSGLLESERVTSILYDDLAAVNDPVYFHEFVACAEAADLQFVAEADLRGSTPVGLAPALVSGIRALATDVVSHEQYMDFVRNQAFRQTLLCRQDVRLTRTLSVSRQSMQDLFIFSAITPPENVDAVMAGGALRVTVGDAELVTDHPLSKAALAVLAAAAPRSLSWDDLVRHAAAIPRSGAATPADLDMLSATLLRAFFTSRSLVGLSTLRDRFTTAVAPRPAVSPLVRLLASGGQPRVPNRRHERVLLDPPALRAVAAMDGTIPVDDLRPLYSRTGQPLEALLAWLARSALLEAVPASQ
jgi:hypothetical protein